MAVSPTLPEEPQLSVEAQELLAKWQPGKPLPGATYRLLGPVKADRPKQPSELRLGL